MNIAQLQAFDPGEFLAAAATWSNAAEAMSSSQATLRTVGGTVTGWIGPAAQAATTMVDDLMTVGHPAAEALDSASTSLRTFVSAVLSAQNSLRAALAQAQAGNFTVAPDGTVTPPPTPRPTGPDAAAEAKLLNMGRQDEADEAGQIEEAIQQALTAATTADQLVRTELADVAAAARQAQLLETGSGGSVDQLNIDVVLSAVGDPRANAALKASLEKLLDDPKNISAGDIKTFINALGQLPPSERGRVADALANTKPLDNLGQALRDEHPLSTWDSIFGGGDPPLDPTDAFRLQSLLLANADPSTVSAIFAAIPGIDPSLAGVSGWKGINAGYHDPGEQVLDPGQTVNAGDVSQGGIGDCYFVSSLIAVAKVDPNFVAQHIHPNGNGTTTVTLYQNGQPVQITVTDTVPWSNTNAVWSNGPDAGTSAPSSSWPALYEKAYAQLRGGYGTIDQGGWGNQGLSAVTGLPTTTVSSTTSDTSWIPVIGGAPNPPDVSAGQLQALLHNKQAVVVGTNSTGNDNSDDKGTLIESHQYVVQSADGATGMVTLRNPWDPKDTVTEPWSKLQSQLDEVVWTQSAP